MPEFHAWPTVVAAVGLLLVQAALSAAEVALFSLGAEQMDSLERQHRHGVYSARALLKFRDETLMTLLITDYLASLSFVGCVVVAFSHLFPDQPWLWAGLGGLVSVAALLVFGQYLPRAVGRSFSAPISMAMARPIVGLTVLVAPLRWLILGVSNRILGIPSEGALEREMANEEELKALITGSDLKGGLEEDERELITGVVEFGSTQVGEIMTPQPEIRAFSDELSREDVLKEMRACEFRRVLVYTASLDNIRGVLHAKDLFMHPQTDYREMLRKPLVVPETKGLMELLGEFRRRRTHLAVVCDEFGRTAGIVTMHDLIEEIVGDIAGEEAPGAEPIREVGPSTWLVPGRTDIYDLRERLGLEIPEEMGRTVSGFVANELGRIPTVGDTIETNGFRLTVERMGVRRVALLRIERHEAAPAESAREDQA